MPAVPHGKNATKPLRLDMQKPIMDILPIIHFDIITIFPEMFDALKYGIVGRAIGQKIISLNYINPRIYSKNRYGSIDDSPYGGGPGMVMMVEPLHQAIQTAKQGALSYPATTSKLQPKPTVIHLSPQGRPLDQRGVEELAQCPHLIMLSGRYEGIDERLIELEVDSEWSIGDYVLSGGELAAMVMIDAITRTLPNALGDSESAQQDSFTTGLLDHPHYTRPSKIYGKSVPEVLQSGDHRAITRWRLKQALGRTWLRRPDLLQQRGLTDSEIALLSEFIAELRSPENGIS
jgi:tRNA (guanine37-N1)-methyltransferase